MCERLYVQKYSLSTVWIIFNKLQFGTDEVPGFMSFTLAPVTRTQCETSQTTLSARVENNATSAWTRVELTSISAALM